MWFSYSSLSTYSTCPKQYEYDKVKDDPPPSPESKHNAIIGSVTQRVFEDFYNEDLWKEDNVLEELNDRASTYFQNFIEENYIDWNDVTCRFDSRSEPLREIYDIIPKTLQAIKRENLVGVYSESEVKIKTPFEDHILFGYIDFIIRKEDGTIMLMDGKSSRHREEYVDEKQLYFYCLLFFKHYHVVPDEVGFFYFRFGDDEDRAFDWIDVTEEDVAKTQSDVAETIDQIENESFPANPHYSHCQWCLWEQVCDERLEQKKKNRAKRKLRSNKEEIETEGDEVEENVGFDDLG